MASDPTHSEPATIPAAVQLAAKNHASRVAYLEQRGDTQRAITWAELAESAQRLALGLRSLGLNNGDRVAICAENSIDWIIAYLGTAFAGGVGVLIYHDLQPEEIRHQIAWPECSWLFASAEVLEGLGASPPDVRLIRIDGDGSEDQLSLTTLTAPSRYDLPKGGDLAAVIFTSGTTGGAKGVMLSHANFLTNAKAALQVVPLSREDSALLVLPLYHAMPFLAAVVLVSLVGARVVIQNDLLEVRDSLLLHQPTGFFGVPALFDLVYRNIEARAEAEGRLSAFRRAQQVMRLTKRLTGLNLGPLLFRPVHRALGGRMRFLVSGGAALSPDTALNYFSLGLPLIQGWGMSEAAPIICLQRFSSWRFRLTRAFERHVGSVGPPLPGIEIRLADVPEKDISVEASSEGEVLIRGPNVFAGYWNSPELTAESKEGGWLHTGDLGRIDAKANVVLTGRSKSVIILDSGEKVHLEELEEKVAHSALIHDVCVVGRSVREKTVVTAVVYPDHDGARSAFESADLENSDPALTQLLAEEVSLACKDLASYKRIGRIEISDQPLPRTALRKVARGELQASHSFSHQPWLEFEATATAQD